MQSCAKAKAYINWIQSTRLPAKAKRKGVVNSWTFPGTSRRFYDMEVVMKLTGQYDGIMFWHAWKMPSKLRIGTKKTGLTHFVVPPTNPEWSILRTNTEWVFTFVQYEATVMVLQSIQTFFFFETETVDLERTLIPHGQPPTTNQTQRIWAGGLILRSKRQSLFVLTSASARIDIETANDRLDRSRWWTKNCAVQAK